MGCWGVGGVDTVVACLGPSQELRGVVCVCIIGFEDFVYMDGGML